MANIEDLTRDEILGMIYHELPNTLTSVHPCFCASCGTGYDENTIYEVEPYWYICDQCNESLSKLDE